MAPSGERYQTPDSVLEGWPEEVDALAKEIYSDLQKGARDELQVPAKEINIRDR